MLFNSNIFIFLFLPAAVITFLVSEKYLGRSYALLSIIIFSAGFYASWNPNYLFLLIGSILVNYSAGLLLGKLKLPILRQIVLFSAIAINLAMLVYFKYLEYLLEQAGFSPDTIGNWGLEKLALPLGISFWTFQQINFLLERYNKRKNNLNLFSYTSIVLFFPHLIAGPIVRTSELGPQVELIGIRKRDLANDISIGSFLFIIGLFKKCFLADSLALIPNTLFSNINGSLELPQVGPVFAWVGIIAYMIQLYFDFSGYCDMGMGLAKIFGLTFPINFNSPLQATNFVDFWKRWHITLTRFFTDTLHAPLSIALFRKYPNSPEFLTISLTIIFTFFVTGIWHGAGNQFIIFGLLNGIFMASEVIFLKYFQIRVFPVSILKIANLFIVSFVFLFFRAPTLSAALEVAHNLFSFGNIEAIKESSLQLIQMVGLGHILLLIAAIYICLFLPNIYQRLEAHFEPIGFKSLSSVRKPKQIEFNQKTAIATAIIFIVSVCILTTNKSSEFIYFQF